MLDRNCMISSVLFPLHASFLPSFLNPSILEVEHVASVCVILTSPNWMLYSRSLGACVSGLERQRKEKKKKEYL